MQEDFFVYHPTILVDDTLEHSAKLMTVYKAARSKALMIGSMNRTYSRGVLT